MRVLITGGAGYLGALATARLLREGHTVRVLDNLQYGGGSLLAVASEGGFEFCKGDVRDPTTVQRSVAGIQAVVHLANGRIILALRGILQVQDAVLILRGQRRAGDIVRRYGS